MTSYALVRPTIATGDILLYEGNSLFGNLIKGATKSPYCHVGLARWDSGRLMTYQSMEGHGVECVPLSSMLKGNVIHVLRTPESPRQITWSAALDTLGDRYSWPSILHIAWRILWGRLNIRTTHPIAEHKGQFICSEYVAMVLAASGYHVPWDTLGFIAPSDFGDDPNLTPIATITGP